MSTSTILRLPRPAAAAAAAVSSSRNFSTLLLSTTVARPAFSLLHAPRTTNARSLATPPKTDGQPEAKPDDPWIYSKERDPMANMSEAEKDDIRKTIRTESQRAFSVGYGIIGGGMLAVGVAMWYNLSWKKDH
ncbi:hypothetical protein HKX48_001920 [Thoreauomyces humboldtii]|nr:hypothetical protein HKX48_001920 [Thoreauomyces humboldtii]